MSRFGFWLCLLAPPLYLRPRAGDTKSRGNLRNRSRQLERLSFLDHTLPTDADGRVCSLRRELVAGKRDRQRHLNGQTAARYASPDNPRAMIVERGNAHEAPLTFTALRR